MTLDEPEDNHHLEWEAIRQTMNCPTCGGSNHHWRVKCDDCTDGKIDMARLLAVAAAAINTQISTDGIHVYSDWLDNTIGLAANYVRMLQAVQP